MGLYVIMHGSIFNAKMCGFWINFRCNLTPYHPQTQDKIERWHRSMKNKILLNKYYFPSELQEQLQRFVNYYNHERYHESLDNLTPADVYYGRGQEILEQRENIKLSTLAMRRQLHYDRQSKLVTQMS